MAALLLVLMVAASVAAMDGGRNTGIPPLTVPSAITLGWYDVSTLNTSSIAVLYNNPSQSIDEVRALLDVLHGSKRRAVLEVPRDSVRYVRNSSVALSSWVAALYDHPAVLAWYLWDEPNESTMPNTTLAVAYDTIRRADPLHHNVSLVMSPGYWPQTETYKDCFDVLLCDDYPCVGTNPAPTGGAAFEQLRATVDGCGTVARRLGRPFWFVQQGFGEQLGHRSCTAAEARFSAFSALQAGATGLVGWRVARTTPTWVNNVWQPLALDVAALGATLSNPVDVPDMGSNSSGLRLRAFRAPNLVLWLTAVSNATTALRIRVDTGALPATSVSRVDASGTVINTLPCHAGTFVDTFEPLGVNLYEVLI
eukprot:m.60771 g.60771  ORF g.60771 m.60771 type:complete len:366 (+) comp13134_c1_seq1:171-1268(+)